MTRTMLIFLLVAAVNACSSSNDADAIDALIGKGAQLAEAKQIGDLIDLTGEGFVALPGSYDAMSVRGILFRTFKYYGTFKILYPKPAVELDSTEKTASATVYFLIVKQGQKMPRLKDLYDDPVRWLETAGKMADLYRLELLLEKPGSKWLVYEAHLEGFKGRGF